MTTEQLIAIQFLFFCFWGLIAAVIKCFEIWEKGKGFGDLLCFLGLLVLSWCGLKFLILFSYIAKNAF